MTNLKAFAHIYSKSVTSFDYYKEMLKTRTAYTVKYFLTLCLLLTVVASIKVSIVSIPLAQQAVVDITDSARAKFPEDLVITIEDNNWSINKPEPFVVPFDDVEKPSDTNEPQNLLVLHHEGEIEDLERFDTLVLVNAKNILVREANKLQVYPLENLPNGTFTRTDFDNLVSQILDFAKNLPYILVLFIFFGTLFYFVVFQGSNVLTLALFTWIASAVMKKGLGYGASARVTTHASTLPLTILVLGRVAGYSIPVPFWFELLVLVLAITAISRLKKGEIDKEAASIEAK